jgi:hypothetical protein
MTLTFDTERAKAHIQRFNNETVVYEPSPKTKARYDRIWNAWEQYMPLISLLLFFADQCQMGLANGRGGGTDLG